MKNLSAILLVGSFHLVVAFGNDMPTPETGAAASNEWTMLAVRMSLNPESIGRNPSPPVRGIALGIGWLGVDGPLHGVGIGGLSVISEGGSGVACAGFLALSGSRDMQKNRSCWRGVQSSLVFSGTDDCSGVQFGLIGAASERLSGIQVGGLAAIGEQLDGISAGCVFNSVGTGNGIVCSLGFTSTGNALALANAPSLPFCGLQLAGIANFASDIYGTQVALGANVSDVCHGVQASAIYNRTEELHGLQIGLVNEARSGAGVQIGLFNFFGDGDDRLLLPIINARF